MSDGIRDGGSLLEGSLAWGIAAGGRQLFGRAGEIEALLGVLGGLKTAGGRAIALVGEPGIGKSALMFTAVAHARAAGVRVDAAQGQYAITPTFPGLRSLLDEPCDVREQVARGGAAVVAVDDLHHLAADQIPGLERVLQATATGPLLCLLAYRQRQLSPALAAVLSRAISAGLLEVWQLGPLSRAATRELLGERPDLEKLHCEGQGNPQYLKIMASDDQAIAAAGTAILGELAGLDNTALTVLHAAAVFDHSFHPELLAAALGLELTETMRALDLLTGLDLVRPANAGAKMILRHPAVGAVVYQQIEPSRRRDLHRRSAAALAKLAVPIARRAHHVARSLDPNEPEHLTTLIAASRDALHASPAVSAGYLEVILPLLREGGEHWHEARVLLAQTRLLTGDAAESRALLDTLRRPAAGQPPHRNHDLTALADASRVERQLGRYNEAGAVARAGLAALADRDCAAAAALHSELADCAYDLQDYESCRQHAETAAAIARRNHDRVNEAKSLAQVSLAHLFTGELAAADRTADSAVELVDAVCDATLLTNLEALYQVGMAEGILGRLAAAERHLTRGAALSRRTGQTYIQPALLMALANTQLRGGDLRRTLATLDEADRHTELDGNPAIQAVLATIRSEALLWRGGSAEWRGALASADRAAALADGQSTAWAVNVRCSHAELVLITGDPARAGRLLLDAAGGVDLPRITTWRQPRCYETLARAAIAEGDRTMAEHWAHLAETRVDELPSANRRGYARRTRMWAHRMRGDLEQARLSGLAAVVDFTVGGERIEVGRTLVAVAALALDTLRTEQVDGWLDQAAALAQQCGSARLADEVSHQRARLFTALAAPAAPAAPSATVASDAQGGADPAVLALLTGREREIARLASTGLTSGEIASTLFLSVRTVDSHLGRIYRKLGVSNRASLTRLLSEAPGAA
ncbi:helix-turn-helix transcriptional regulator [Kitasatospora kifunensis]|uniref:DNA-binding CsgD family transcriptional regulator/RecA/RadA recombinase n=1 Tax=Kitasatospora kifunensis TaxID=58351 RepID=A0A7W7W0P1_KITKI|nr:LuxR family transcriptional regulator [Kitasatospora kifunensis]MBB4928919.1 DNA-binding CsgD family transcriptional regulator/RecA/RadA recombinase [Kitasatospora kifunensis]